MAFIQDSRLAGLQGSRGALGELWRKVNAEFSET